MITTVLGVYDTAHPQGRNHEAMRRKCITEKAVSLSLPAPTFDFPDFMQATVEAVDRSKQGHRVILLGAIDDLHAKTAVAGSISDHEWREAWVEYLSESSLVWVPLTASPPLEPQALSRKSVIRSYQRSCRELVHLLAKIRSQRSMAIRSKSPGYSYGRPPYGYAVVSGKLVPQPAQVILIREVFKHIRDGVPLARVAMLMRSLKATSANGQAEFWDAVKIRRLVGHIRLYCMGEYDTPGGERAVVPELAVLPKAWASTVIPRKAAAVPSARKPDRVGASHTPHPE